MNLKYFLAESTAKLNAAGISTARLDVLVLLEDVLNTNRTQILASPEREITVLEAKELNSLVAKRCRHWPLAYLRGKTEFYGREFIINRHVLEPRPESETMIDLLKSIKEIRKSTIVDVGTGSGALAITTKLEQITPNVLAVDVDKNCVAQAVQNAKKYDTDIKFVVGDLLEPLINLQDVSEPLILLCNLPYVPDGFHINPAAMNEPKIAIFGGKDGLDIYRKLFMQIDNIKQKPLFVLTEALPPQHENLSKIAESAGYRLEQTDDFIQVFKIAVI